MDEFSNQTAYWSQADCARSASTWVLFATSRHRKRQVSVLSHETVIISVCLRFWQHVCNLSTPFIFLSTDYCRFSGRGRTRTSPGTFAARILACSSWQSRGRGRVWSNGVYLTSSPHTLSFNTSHQPPEESPLSCHLKICFSISTDSHCVGYLH